MSNSKRCKACGNPVDLDQAKDGACPWCLAAFTFSPEPVGNPVTASKDLSKQFGKYVRTEKLGAGGMGEVWKALDTELNRYVALKFLKDDDASSTVRFQREARTAASLSHSGIASIHEVGEVDGRHFIAMQYVQGRTMAHFPRQDRRLVVRLFRDAARALDHAHRHGVIHRDLKPENLMVEEREDGWHVVILDFGLARSIEGGEKLSKSGEVYGTAAYMSPEQARGDHLDERADVYSLGATMYEVLTGKPPFRGANLLELLRKVGAEEPVKPRKLNPRIHRDLETIVLKCLEKDRDRRYSNARELAEDLERFLNSDPILARPPSTLYRLRLTLGKRKAQGAAVAIAAIALLGFGAAWIYHWKPQAEQSRLFREGLAVREEMLRLSMAPRVDRERLRRRAAEARSLFEQANERIETPEAHVMRGRCFQVEGKASEAMAAFERAHALRPGDPEGRIEIARGLLMQYQERRTPSLKVMFGDRNRQWHKAELAPESDDAKKLRERAELLLDKGDVGGEKLDLLRGLLALGRGNYTQAADLLHRYNKVDGLDLQALHLEGWSRFLANDLPGAIEVLSRMTSLAPAVSDLLWLGAARHQSGDFKGAIAEFTRAIELKANSEGAFMRRGLARQAAEDYKGALGDFTRAIEIRPNHGPYYSHRATVRRLLSDLQGSMADHDKAVHLDPQSSAHLIDRGSTKADLKDYKGAIDDCSRGLELDPTQHAGYLTRGRSREKLGDLPGAIADYTEGLKHSLDPADFHVELGEARRKLNENDAAEDHFVKALALDPRNSDALTGRGMIKYGRRDFDGALADYTKAIEIDPRQTQALHMRGEIRSDRGDVTGAVSDWTKALEASQSESTDFREHLEEHLEDAREYGHRWAELNQAVKEYHGAFRLTREKQYERAAAVFAKVAESFPKSAYGRDSAYNTACVYALMGKKDSALDWLEKSVLMGYRNFEHMTKDTDLDSLREEGRYKKIMETHAPK